MKQERKTNALAHGHSADRMKRIGEVASRLLASVFTSLLLTVLLQPQQLSAQWLSGVRDSSGSLSMAAARPGVELSAYTPSISVSGPNRSRNFIIAGAILGGAGGYFLRPVNTSDIEYVYPAVLGGYIIGGAVIGAIVGNGVERVSRSRGMSARSVR
jgi:hypothetical protein